MEGIEGEEWQVGLGDFFFGRGDFGGSYATSFLSTCLNNARYNAEFGLTVVLI